MFFAKKNEQYFSLGSLNRTIKEGDESRVEHYFAENVPGWVVDKIFFLAVQYGQVGIAGMAVSNKLEFSSKRRDREIPLKIALKMGLMKAAEYDQCLIVKDLVGYLAAEGDDSFLEFAKGEALEQAVARGYANIIKELDGEEGDIMRETKEQKTPKTKNLKA